VLFLGGRYNGPESRLPAAALHSPVFQSAAFPAAKLHHLRGCSTRSRHQTGRPTA